MNSTLTTNRLLIILVVPLIFYLLHILSFIFVPLISSMFIALLFVPLMRRLKKRGLPKVFYVSISVGLMVLFGVASFVMLRLSSEEILSTQDAFLEKAGNKIENSEFIQTYVLPPSVNRESQGFSLDSETTMQIAQPVLKFVSNLLPQLLMTLFFVILWLSESINFESVMNSTFIKMKHTSVKTFRRIEKDIITFIVVKFLISFGTGVFTGLFCYLFDVSFPIFWGIFAFAINFVQMVGSFITVILCSLFAFVELDQSGSLLFFVLTLTGTQVLFGSILEPIYMGKSFSLNVITVLIMLMFWGFIWGIPGMILSIPITVFLKILFEQFNRTKVIAQLMG